MSTEQLNLFDLLEQTIEITAYDPNLTKEENEIKDYIYNNHKGYQNGITQKELSEIFELGFEEDGGRSVRRIMANITEKSFIDFDAGDYGYFACIKEHGEIRNGNRIKRTISSLKMIANGNPDSLRIIYKALDEIKAEL